jgi:hypothetical protein
MRWRTADNTNDVRAMTAFARAAAVLVVLGSLGGCAATEKAAQRDPVMCDRNPNCAKYRGSYQDCTQQCVDDPSCMDRCREIQADPTR